MKRKVFSALLAAAVLAAALIGCGKADPGSLSASVNPAVSGPDSRTDQTEWSSFGGLGTLDDLRAAAGPDAMAGLAYLGLLDGPFSGPALEGMESDGYWPLVSRTRYEEMYYHPQGGPAYWCVVPLQDDVRLELYVLNWQGSKFQKGEKLCELTGSRPVILTTPTELEQPGLIAVFTAPDGTTTKAYPFVDPQTFKPAPALPEDGTVYDFTVHPAAPEPNWRLMGEWVWEGEAGGQLSLDGDGYADLLVRTSAGGTKLFAEGRWERIGADRIRLSLKQRADEGGWLLPGSEPPAAEGEYSFTLEAGNVLTLTPQKQAPAIVGDQDVLRLHMVSNYESRLRWEEIYQEEPLPELLRTAHESRTGRPADCARVIGGEQTGVLWQVYEQGEDGILTTGLYLYDGVDTGTDWLYGGSLGSQDGGAQYQKEADVCSAAAAYYEMVTGSSAPIVSIDSRQGNEVTLHLYEDMDDHTATLAWYTVDLDSWVGTDDITGEAIDLNDAASRPAGPSDGQPDAVRAAMDYYERRTGYRPGAATVEGMEGGGQLVHLYDDMGTHTATCAWYVVYDDLTGLDWMTGELIDFNR